jgi:hypothetical protein
MSDVIYIPLFHKVNIAVSINPLFLFLFFYNNFQELIEIVTLTCGNY